MKIFPEALPSSVRADLRRRAEVAVYEALVAQLSDPWVVFYSVPWIGWDRPGSRRADGEADFVVAHPGLGFIAIEVKGGEVKVGREGWVSIDRAGVTHKIKDPFQQASRSKHILQDKIRQSRAWRGKWVCSAHAVIFPDVEKLRSDLRPHAPADIVIPRDELPNLGHRLREIAEAAQQAGGQAQEDGRLLVSVLIDLVARSIFLRNPLRYQLEDEEAEILRLTEAQFDILYQLKNFRRAAISGCAGSGKTMLAVEKARRLARLGQRVLLTCYNRPLADHLAKATEADEGLDVHSFHSLCLAAADQAGVSISVGDDLPGRVFEKDYPEALFEAMTTHRELAYDAVLVDEGQDIRGGWWAALESCLSEPKTSTFYVFFDDNQTLYPDTCVPSDLPVFALSANVRNTRQIVGTLRPLHPSGPQIEARGPTGRSIEAIACSSQTAKRELERVLGRLVAIESVQPRDIVVLSLRAAEQSYALDAKLPGNLRIGKQPAERTVLIETVRRFKGLESAVAVVVDLDSLTPDDKELLYVALSRARSHLVLLGSEEIVQEVVRASRSGHE